MSTVTGSNLSVQVLKSHLAEFLKISDQDLVDTSLSWRLLDNEKNLNFVCSIVDDTNAISMARHVLRAADGFVDIYAIIPENVTVDSAEEDAAEEQHFGEQQYSEAHHDINQYQVYEEQHLQEHHVEQNQHVQEQQEDMHVQHPEMHDHHHSEEQQEDGVLIEQLNEQIQPNAAKKLPVVRAARQVLDKGKGIQDVSAHDDVLEEDIEDDSDYEDVHEEDSEDSSGDDEEAICYRKQALELKKIVKRRMLGEVEDKGTKVPEEFIVPEEIEEEAEDGSDCIH
jgi:hypothetical protein